MECRYPPQIDNSWWLDHQWSLWWADCCSGWQFSDQRIGPTMNTPKSLGVFCNSNHVRFIEWSRWNDRLSFQTEDFSNIWVNSEIDGVWGLDPDTSITRSLRRYREWSVSHGVEQSNDFTDRVVANRNPSLFVIGIRQYIYRINIDEHDLIGSEQDSEESGGRIPILVPVDPFESTIGKHRLYEHGVMHFSDYQEVYSREKRPEMVFSPSIFRWQSISRLISNEGQKYKSSGTKLRCSCELSVDGCLRVTLANMTEHDNQVVSRFLHQSPTS